MQGVGGRRWTKLANALSNLGNEIHVISAQPQIDESSFWNVESEIKITRLPGRFPDILNRVPNSLVEKIHYRLSLLSLKLLTTSNYYDRGVFWGSYFNKIIYPYITENKIKKIIVTGGPFSLLYYAAKMKSKHSEITLLADIRDEWGSDNFYGFGLLSKKRKKEEFRRLKYTIEKADIITVPYPYMKEKYSRISPGNAHKVCILRHGFDSVFINNEQRPKVEKFIYLVNFGSIHSGQDLHLKGLSQALIKADIKITFYSREKKYYSVFKENNLIPEKVNYCATVNEEKVSEILKKSTAALLFVPAHFKDSISTKYMEIVATKTPIVAIGVVGEVSTFIIENRLGIFIPYHEIEYRISNLGHELKELAYNFDFDIKSFLFESQANQILEMINTNHANP